MKTIGLHILLFAALALPTGLQAQEVSSGGLSIENTKATKENDRVVLSAQINTAGLDLGSQEMVYVTPILYSADSSQAYRFDPVIIAGSTRYKVLQREIRLNNQTFEGTPQTIAKYKKRKEPVIPVNMSVAFQPWMENSKLILHEDFNGCACENEGTVHHVAMARVLPKAYVPTFTVAYILPPEEAVKERSETYTAHINYESGKYTVSPHFKNNWEELQKADSILSSMRNDPNLNIRNIKITGYSSPDGNQVTNMKLSQKRAEGFVFYLRELYKLPASAISAEWKGEDWEGLRASVVRSTLPDKPSVLNIIDYEPDIDKRDGRLKQLSGGSTYQTLLKDYYPSLRRNEYTLSFLVKGFDLNEAKEMIKTKPQYLSQQEMYLVAQSYPANSPEFRNIFQIIEQSYPDNEVAAVNSLAAKIGFATIPPAALARVAKIEKAEVWNNMGIISFNLKDYPKAVAYFQRAAAAGLPEGVKNLEEINKFLK